MTQAVSPATASALYLTVEYTVRLSSASGGVVVLFLSLLRQCILPHFNIYSRQRCVTILSFLLKVNNKLIGT